MSSLSLRTLSKTFQGTGAVRGVSLDVTPGEFFAILGPSGCGKTTLLRLVAGYERPDAGSIVIDGQDVTSMRPQERGIGMVFQNYALFPHLTVHENVAFGLQTRGIPAEETRERVDRMLGKVRLSGKAAVAVTSLSGGEQQRVAVARALVLRPRLLLFDEPLSNLDAALRLSTREEIRILQREEGVTTLYVTHDQSEAMTLADRIAVMRSGSIEQVGPPRELYDLPASPFVAGFLGGANLVEGTTDGITFVAGELRIPLPPSHRGPAPGPATLAVKPEGVLLSEEGGEGSVPTRVVMREYLGFTTAFRLRVGETELRSVALSSSFTAGLEPGHTVGCAIDWTRATIFPGGA